MGNEDSIFAGKTLEVAVRKGLESLGLTRAEAKIAVLEEGSGGFLGLGARPFRVRITERPGGAIAESGGRDRHDRGSGRGRRGERDGRQRRNGAARGSGRGRPDGRGDSRRAGRSDSRGAGRSDSRGAGRSDSRGAGRSDSRGADSSDSRGADSSDSRGAGRSDSRRDGRGDSGRERSVSVESQTRRETEDVRGGDEGERRRRRGRRGGRRRREREGERRPVEGPGTGAPVVEMPPATQESPAAAVDPATQTATVAEVSVNADELAAKGKQCTEELLRAMGFEANVTATADDERVDVDVSIPDNEDLLTGPKGEVRQALQHLLNLMLNRGGGSRYHLQLEINDFWEKREIELRDLARALADEANDNQGEAMTEYLNAQERRIIHVTLRDDDRVRTYALGSGLIKRVTVAPADFPEPQA